MLYLNNATIKVAGSSIDKFYVGGETEDKSVTGIINNINTHLISGSIENLDSGTSNGTPLTIDDENYKVTATNSIKITNDNLGSSKSAIDYDFSVPTKNIKLFVNQNMKIEAIVTTNPAGYEEVFNDLFSYSVDDDSVPQIQQVTESCNDPYTTFLWIWCSCTYADRSRPAGQRIVSASGRMRCCDLLFYTVCTCSVGGTQ